MTRRDLISVAVGASGAALAAPMIKASIIPGGFSTTEGPVRRKYTDKDIAGILGGNLRRALTQIWT